ncbi:MAG: L,D-transpeptidase, partial [Nannocystaceae bacterium]
AWSVRRRAEVYDRPSLTKGKIVRRLDYHEQVDIGPEPQRNRQGVFEVLPGGGRDGADGYVLTADIRHYVPGLPQTDIAADEVWIDVDVGQQVLAIMVGETTEFITLISSGSHKHPTPPGLYRIRYKLAYGKMQSRDEVDEDEVYYVEAVPWVQYFHNRYALHSAFWHNSFGRRRSHGCINLAPADAARVFERTAPELAPGFTSIHERPRELGTNVRIRKGSEPVEDRRRELSTVVDDEQDVDTNIDDNPDTPTDSTAGDDAPETLAPGQTP